MLPSIHTIREYKPLGTDADLLGSALQECDRGADFTSGNNYYRWYFAIARMKRAKRIFEMGVRYGYSLLAMAHGANAAGITPELLGIDGEIDIPGSNNIALASLRKCVPCKAQIVKAKTSERLSAWLLPSVLAFDLVHVDADHSHAGLEWELTIANVVANEKDGWILVDDVEVAELRAIAEKFAADNKRPTLYIETLRGMLLIGPPAL